MYMCIVGCDYTTQAEEHINTKMKLVNGKNKLTLSRSCSNLYTQSLSIISIDIPLGDFFGFVFGFVWVGGCVSA